MLDLFITPDCYWEPVRLKKPDVVYRAGDEALAAFRIAAVGALYQPAYGFCQNDQAWLKDSIAVFEREKRINPAQPIIVAPMNILCGRNVLKETGARADLFLACLIYNPSLSEPVGCSRRQPVAHWTSPNHRERGVWGAAAARMGASHVIAYSVAGKREEIAGRDFVAGGPYKMLASDILPACYGSLPLSIRRDVLTRRESALRL